MEFIYEPPTNLILAFLLSTLAVASAWRGTRLFFKGLRNSGHPSGSLWLVRGIRGEIVAIAMGLLAAGVFWAKGWLLIFAGIFLGEELYETGCVIVALRWGKNASSRKPSLK
ncbi:MAG: hypothetical protein ACE5JS_00070 [Nitrospinota bacterium]